MKLKSHTSFTEAEQAAKKHLNCLENVPEFRKFGDCYEFYVPGSDTFYNCVIDDEAEFLEVTNDGVIDNLHPVFQEALKPFKSW